MNIATQTNALVIPAKAGIQLFAQMKQKPDSSFRWNDKQKRRVLD
jgi:hypothetical protein